MTESRVCVVQPVAALAREILLAVLTEGEGIAPKKLAGDVFDMAEAYFAEGQRRGYIELATVRPKGDS